MRVRPFFLVPHRSLPYKTQIAKPLLSHYLHKYRTSFAVQVHSYELLTATRQAQQSFENIVPSAVKLTKHCFSGK